MNKPTLLTVSEYGGEIKIVLKCEDEGKERFR
jgi:hypothetical protein